MTPSDSHALRNRMVDRQIAGRGVRDRRVLEAMRTVRQYPLIERIQRVAEGGRVLQSYGADGETRAISATEIDQLRSAWPVGAARRPVPTAIARGEAGAWSVAIAERATADILLADLRSETLASIVRDVQHRNGDVILLVDRQGIVLSHPDVSLVRTSLYSLPGWKAAIDLPRVLNDPRVTEINLGEIHVQIWPAPERR